MCAEVPPNPEEPKLFKYTAFDKMEYRQLIYREEREKAWIDFADSFYRASEVIIGPLADGRGFPDVEGVAAVHLFRHYLELALKRIIICGRWLVDRDVNAATETVVRVKRIHNLRQLWDDVIAEAKPKLIHEWDKYDIGFVERCIEEFHEHDETGFAFRYPKNGGERYEYDFRQLCESMEHVRQILNGLTVCLEQLYADNAEYQSILRQEAGF